MWVCVYVLSPGSFNSNSVYRPLSHRKPCCGTAAHTQIVVAQKHTCTHTHTWNPSLQLGVPCRIWLRGFVPLSGSLCQVSPHYVQQQRHAHTYTHTQSWRCSIEQLTTQEINGMLEGCGCWERRGGGGNWHANFTVIGQAISLIIDYSSWLKAHNLITYNNIYKNVAEWWSLRHFKNKWYTLMKRHKSPHGHGL